MRRATRKKIQNYTPINKNLPALFRLWPFKRVKQLQNDGKYGIFQYWPDTRRKIETQDPNVYPTILGAFREVFGVRSYIWALKVPFLALEKALFLSRIKIIITSQ